MTPSDLARFGLFLLVSRYSTRTPLPSQAGQRAHRALALLKSTWQRACDIVRAHTALRARRRRARWARREGFFSCWVILYCLIGNGSHCLGV